MSIEKLKSKILEFQQTEVPTEHLFCDGVYVRTMTCVAETLVVGKVHKRDHVIMLLSGRVTVSDENGPRELVAPTIMKCEAGTQRALFFHEPSVWVNVHRTDQTDIEAVEDELVVADPDSPFLPGNKLPQPLLETG
jgi:hypothetical protein